MRLRVIVVLSLLAAGLNVRPAEAVFHLMSIVEVFPGTAAAPDAQYVVLQMYFPGQNLVDGHPVYFYDASGALVDTFTFGDNVANGADQAKILIATAQAQAFFGVTPDLLMTSAAIRAGGGKICFDTIDCVAWGNYAPVDASVGTAFERPVGLTPGRAVRRDVGGGTNPAALDASDDTNDSAADFDYATPAPRNNANQAGAPPASVCQNNVLEGLEDCDDGNAVPDDACNAVCSLTRLFADGAETGDLSRWHAAATDGGDLTAAGAAASAGSFGLQGVVDDVSALYVQNDSPAGESRYRARFYFDPNGFDPGEASGARRTRLFIAFRAPSRRMLAIVLRRLNGQYGVLGRARRDDNSQAGTGFFDITDGPHWIEVDWRRSSGPGASDGSFRLWIDGALLSTLTGIDNDTGAVDFVRLGALSVKATASGTIYWDQFDSRRETFIGP